jgi:hypothetical protein
VALADILFLAAAAEAYSIDWVAPPQLAEKIQSIAVGQANIANKQVNSGICGCLDGPCTASSDGHGMAGLLKQFSHYNGGISVILNKENLDGPIGRSFRRRLLAGVSFYNRPHGHLHKFDQVRVELPTVYLMNVGEVNLQNQAKPNRRK